ncbi:hypothetical protein BM221_001686 [Beauveria bassiana]|uniref:Uncharacterized protein n=1 Tax=Beauveria bassiana TaxID=176275 RepID=A0A2N6NWE3_BEABA|nr:hypothetical protein BM221_001686 [Beauveria bassiana]
MQQSTPQQPQVLMVGPAAANAAAAEDASGRRACDQCRLRKSCLSLSPRTVFHHRILGKHREAVAMIGGSADCGFCNEVGATTALTLS